MQVDVLFSRDSLLALNKPAGICSQGPGEEIELWQLARARFPMGNIPHRLDQHTSGVHLATTARSMTRYLMANWHEITRKCYLAVILAPKWEKITVGTPIKGKSAVTEFTVLERADEFALVLCQLIQNGRMHQIRQHLRSVGSPIVGDKKYKGPKTSLRAGQLLHAWHMEVRLPNGEWIAIQAPIPDDFRQLPFAWDRWDAGASSVLESWPVVP